MGNVTALGSPVPGLAPMVELLRSINAAAPGERTAQVFAAGAMRDIAKASNPQTLCPQLLLLDVGSEQPTAYLAIEGSPESRQFELILFSASQVEDPNRLAALGVAALGLTSNPMLISVCVALSAEGTDMRIHRMLKLEDVEFVLDFEAPAAASEGLVPIQLVPESWGKLARFATNDAGMMLVLRARAHGAAYVPIDPSEQALQVFDCAGGERLPPGPSDRIPVPFDKRALLNRSLPLDTRDFALPERVKTGLRSVGVEFIGELVQKTEGDLLRIRNFGRKSLKDVKDWLHSQGLSLKMDVGNWRRPQR